MPFATLNIRAVAPVAGTLPSFDGIMFCVNTTCAQFLHNQVLRPQDFRIDNDSAGGKFFSWTCPICKSVESFNNQLTSTDADPTTSLSIDNPTRAQQARMIRQLHQASGLQVLP